MLVIKTYTSFQTYPCYLRPFLESPELGMSRQSFIVRDLWGKEVDRCQIIDCLTNPFLAVEMTGVLKQTEKKTLNPKHVKWAKI